MATGLVQFLYGIRIEGLIIGVRVVGVSLGCWFRDVTREGVWGYHSSHMEKAFKEGFFLFLASEVMFFFSLFWAFFHISLAPDINVICVWPPLGVRTFRPWRVPLYATLVLIASGCSIQYAHRSVRIGHRSNAILGVICTIFLAVLFLRLQSHEYYWARFSITDRVYGRVFFILTGFHGMHVIFGSGFLLVTLWRLIRGDFTRKKYYGFRVCSWYWHFVDWVWIFMWLRLYFWRS